MEFLMYLIYSITFGIAALLWATRCRFLTTSKKKPNLLPAHQEIFTQLSQSSVASTKSTTTTNRTASVKTQDKRAHRRAKRKSLFDNGSSDRKNGDDGRQSVPAGDQSPEVSPNYDNIRTSIGSEQSAHSTGTGSSTLYAKLAKTTSGLTRRQRKNRRSNDLSINIASQLHSNSLSIKPCTAIAPVIVAATIPSHGQGSKLNRYVLTQPVAATAKCLTLSRPAATTPQRLTKLNLPLTIIFEHMLRYVIDEVQLTLLGYPVTCNLAAETAVIYKHRSEEIFYNQNSVRQQQAKTTESHFDVNAREFIPITYVNENDGLQLRYDGRHKSESGSDGGDTELLTVETLSGDSGQGSGASSPPSVDSEYDVFDADDNRMYFQRRNSSELGDKKRCMRCGSSFYVTRAGDYRTQDTCLYHWGKLQRTHKFSTFACCNRNGDGIGCTTAKLHVWSGIESGLNGPFKGFVHTRGTRGGIYALDCEMCFTGLGLEVAKVTVVSIDGRQVYEHIVRTESRIIDYNTRFSGITERDYHKQNSSGGGSSSGSGDHVKTLAEVQKDLLRFIAADTILIGHALDNDLRALKLLHKRIVDTSLVFPHYNGLPYRRSLKSLCHTILKRDIQTSAAGHCSYEDSLACVELMLWRIQKDQLMTVN